jgi:hypothetical protein
MIAAPEAPNRSNRILRVAIVLSLLVHLLGALLYIFSSNELSKLLHLDRRPPHIKPDQDEIVTISSSLHIEKRAKPVPVPPPARALARRPPVHPREPAPSAPERVAQLPQPVVRQPAYEAPSLLRHELDKQSKAAPNRPTVTRKAERVTQTPTAEPHTPSPQKPSPAKQVATVEHGQAAAQAEAPSRSSKLSDEQLAQIETDLAKTISQARSRTNPLRNVKPEAPAAPKVYRMQMQGVFGALHRGEGYYYPIKSWRANGLDWYYVSYDFTWENGTYETGSVPWAIHFTPATDPFATNDPSRLRHTPLPPPPVGFVPPGTLGKALRAYFPSLTFSDSDN